MQLEAIASCPVASFLGEETNTLLITTTFHVIVENNKVSPQPPPLHTKQPQSPPTLLIRLVLQTLHQLLLFPAVRYDVCLQPVPSVSRVSPAWKRRAYTPKLGAWYLLPPPPTVMPPTNCRHCRTRKLFSGVPTVLWYFRKTHYSRNRLSKTLLCQKLFLIWLCYLAGCHWKQLH